jgi:hypothetical protein
MVVFVICPFCHQETKKSIVKTETIPRDSEENINEDNDLIFQRCENCDKVWIELKHVSDCAHEEKVPLSY